MGQVRYPGVKSGMCQVTIVLDRQGGPEEVKRQEVSQEDPGWAYTLHEQINNWEAVSHAVKYGSRLFCRYSRRKVVQGEVR